MQKTEIEIPSSRNSILHGTLYAPNSDTPTPDMVILCHGFSGDQHEWGRFPTTAEKFVEKGFSSLTFDFSGSGKNIREPITIIKQKEDLETVFKWCQNQGYSKISIIGLSFGGLTALLADSPERETTVFWAPAFSIKKKIGFIRFLVPLIRLFGKSHREIESPNNEPLMMDMDFITTVNHLNISKRLKNFTGSCLFLQGDADPQITPKYSRKAFKLLSSKSKAQIKNPGLREYNEIADATHDFKGEHLIQFIDLTVAWILRMHQT
ncbi:MAG: alpha/beta hydrolase family protein [Promethearchaeota archaeon]